MKKTICCIRNNKVIGYWDADELIIRTKTIIIYDNEEWIEEAYLSASTYIPYKIAEDIIPIIMILSFETPAESISDRCKKHLQNAKEHWSHMPNRIALIEQAINKISK